MKTLIHVETHDIRGRLQALGSLNEIPLLNAVQQGQLHWSNCTDNHPPLYAPIVAWAETVSALREEVLVLGWVRSDEGNYSRVIDPSRRVAIAVATGDAGTGQSDVIPSTKAPKGPNTIEAITANVGQLDLFLPAPPLDGANDAQPADELQTWILLVHRAHNEIRSELSLPHSMGTDGRVNGWRERIILPAIPIDPEPIEVIAPPQQPDLNIEIKRRG